MLNIARGNEIASSVSGIALVGEMLRSCPSFSGIDRLRLPKTSRGHVSHGAAGQEFLRLAVSGTAIPAVEVQPRQEVYLGRLQPGEERVCIFHLTPASPEMKLRLLSADAPACASQSELVREEDDGTWRLELHVRPDASRRFVLVRRQVAIDWQEETLPPLEIKVRFAVAEGKGQ